MSEPGGDADKSGGPGDAAAAAAAAVTVGTVLRAGTLAADRFLLSDQFLHKALMVVVHELGDGTHVAAVLNRPTANMVQLQVDQSRRCISFGGDGRLRGQGLDIDANGLMWLAQEGTLTGEASDLGTAIGDSGLRRLPALEASNAIKEGHAALSDMLLVSGLVCFEPAELRDMLAAGELSVVRETALAAGLGARRRPKHRGVGARRGRRHAERRHGRVVGGVAARQAGRRRR